jgi:hypothetical protein
MSVLISLLAKMHFRVPKLKIHSKLYLPIVFGSYSDYQYNIPLIEPLNEVRSRGVFLPNKIIRTAVFTGKQPQASSRGTQQCPIWLRGRLSRATQQWCHRGADSKPPGGMQDLVWQKNIP